MNKKILLNLAVFCFILFLLLPFFVSAEEGLEKTLEKIVKTINYLFGTILTGVSILVIIIGGIMLIQGGNEPGKLDTGKKIIIWGIIGLLIGYLAVPLVRWIMSLFFSEFEIEYLFPEED